MNEISSLGVKQIGDMELVRKILHSLWRPDYDLLTTIIYEKELNTLKPNQILNKVIAHELCNDIKPRAPPFSPTHSALACKQDKKLRKMVIKQNSSEEEEEEACQSSSSDEKNDAPQTSQASQDHEQELEEDQHDGVYGIPQRWA